MGLGAPPSRDILQTLSLSPVHRRGSRSRSPFSSPRTDACLLAVSIICSSLSGCSLCWVRSFTPCPRFPAHGSVVLGLLTKRHKESAAPNPPSLQLLSQPTTESSQQKHTALPAFLYARESFHRHSWRPSQVRHRRIAQNSHTTSWQRIQDKVHVRTIPRLPRRTGEATAKGIVRLVEMRSVPSKAPWKARIPAFGPYDMCTPLLCGLLCPMEHSTGSGSL
ncbi:hypothetical protein LZ30DRAFT_206646 [Colletotrichum cereale]|nr:hypothetical protein LZ30DRAFT_206646 [Colletotrichum cereale]